MLMRDSPRPLALELAHKLAALLKNCQLTTGIPLNPVCMTPLSTIILITTRLTHAQFSLVPPREMYGALDARLALRRELWSNPPPTHLPLVAKYFVAPVTQKDVTMPPVIFSVAPDSEDFCPDFAVPAHSKFSLEPDSDLFVAPNFRRDITVPSESSAVACTWPACSYMPTITDSNYFRLGVLFYRGILVRYCSLDLRFSFFSGPNLRVTAGTRPEYILEPTSYDMLSMYPYSIENNVCTPGCASFEMPTPHPQRPPSGEST